MSLIRPLNLWLSIRTMLSSTALFHLIKRNLPSTKPVVKCIGQCEFTHVPWHWSVHWFFLRQHFSQTVWCSGCAAMACLIFPRFAPHLLTIWWLVAYYDVRRCGNKVKSVITWGSLLPQPWLVPEFMEQLFARVKYSKEKYIIILNYCMVHFDPLWELSHQVYNMPFRYCFLLGQQCPEKCLYHLARM